MVNGIAATIAIIAKMIFVICNSLLGISFSLTASHSFGSSNDNFS